MQKQRRTTVQRLIGDLDVLPVDVARLRRARQRLVGGLLGRESGREMPGWLGATVAVVTFTDREKTHAGTLRMPAQQALDPVDVREIEPDSPDHEAPELPRRSRRRQSAPFDPRESQRAGTVSAQTSSAARNARCTMPVQRCQVSN